MQEIFLFRHGDTGYPGRYTGASDVELSSAGRENVHRLQEYLQAVDFDTVICSPLKRCLQTCDLLKLEKTTTIDKRIREIDFGRWEQKTFAEVTLSDPELVRQWTEAGNNFQFPDGEKIPDFIKRIEEFGETIKAGYGRKILIITHGGVIRYLLCSFLNLPFDKYLSFSIDYASLTSLNLYSQGGVMTGLNTGGQPWGK